MIENYPTNEALKEVFANNIAANRSRAFFKEKGILFLSSKRQWIGEEGQYFYFGLDDINRLSSYIETEKNYRKSSRMYIPKADKFDLVVETLEQLYNSGYQGEDNLKVSDIVISEDKAEIQIDYSKKKPGMLDLLSERPRMVKFVIEKAPGNDVIGESIVVDIHHYDDADYRQVKKILDTVAQQNDEHDIEIKEISLEGFSLDERIRLFDDFFGYNFEDWVIDEIKRISVKKGDEEVLPEEEADVTHDQLLRGINSAILNGSSLRTNQFVQAGLRNGFYFSSARVKLSHRREAKRIELDLNFKSRPVMLEVNIFKTYEVIDEEDEPSVFPQPEQIEYLRYFRNVIFEIYNNIIADRIK
ncbi:MAG: hypothetical protein H0Z24_10145 [Thermosipho sp. (in: Bacteria)]|nr:hypothetical protein [Thermosipho sp. (in: thermotogales)]